MKELKIKNEFKGNTGEEIWNKVVDFINANHKFTSVTGIIYSATFVGSCIFLRGGTPGTKRADEGEYLTGKDFVSAYDSIRLFEKINTSIVKPYIKRQQTPFIGLLLSAGIIE